MQPPTPTAEDLYHDSLSMLAESDASMAVAAFRRALALDTTMLDAMHGLIRALQEEGELDEAIAFAQRQAEIDPDEVLAHTSLSILYQHKGMVPEAEAESTRARLLGWKRQLREQKQAP